jgi:hypothetical protein
MELGEYLTGIVLSPDLLSPSRWLDGLCGGDEPAFDSIDEAHTSLARNEPLYRRHGGPRCRVQKLEAKAFAPRFAV